MTTMTSTMNSAPYICPMLSATETPASTSAAPCRNAAVFEPHQNAAIIEGWSAFESPWTTKMMPNTHTNEYHPNPDS